MDFQPKVLARGMIAGFVATIVMTIMMLMKSKMGVMPELNPIHMMTDMASSKLGIEAGPALGWGMHFMIGTVVWGGMFSVFSGKIPGQSYLSKGLVFGVFAWSMMMVGPMPMGGAGFFGANLGAMAPFLTLMMHLVFGAVLGLMFARLSTHQSEPVA